MAVAVAVLSTCTALCFEKVNCCLEPRLINRFEEEGHLFSKLELLNLRFVCKCDFVHT